MPIPAAAISGVAPSFMGVRVSAPAAASARMMPGSRNLAATRYGVAPMRVFGSTKSWPLRRCGVPFVIRAFGSAWCASSDCHERQIAAQHGGVQRGVADVGEIRIGALLHQQRRDGTVTAVRGDDERAGAIGLRVVDVGARGKEQSG